MKVIFAPFPKNKYAKLAVWAILFLVLLGVMLLMRPGTPTITKEDVLRAVYNTQQANQYRWRITSNITFKGVQNNLSNVIGERNDAAVHLKGNFLNSSVELYQIGNVTYRLDPITKQWIIIKDNDIASEEVLNTELNPVAALNFAAINSFAPKGVEYINEKKAYRIEIQPEVASEFMTKYWQDFKYVLWLDKDREYLAGFQVIAKSRKDETGQIHMKVLFSDFGEKIDIKAPL